MDVVGSIIQLGENVHDFKVGDRVAALVRTGGNARYISVSASDLVAVPRACESTEAVCMVSTYMTAYQCIRTATDNSFILKKKRVLITGGTEPVGQALIQLCFRAGATEIFASGPDRSQRYIRTILGAHPLPADPKRWMETVKGSMDVVFDGTCYDGFESTSAALNEHGILVSLGMSALLNRETPGILGAPMVAYWEKLKSDVMPHSTSYEVWHSFRTEKEAYKLDLAILLQLLKKRFIKPHVSKRVSLSHVADAHHILEHKNAHGEMVCLPWKRIGNT
jgi:NADPH:quinone reductase